MAYWGAWGLVSGKPAEVGPGGVSGELLAGSSDSGFEGNTYEHTCQVEVPWGFFPHSLLGAWVSRGRGESLVQGTPCKDIPSTRR